MRPPVGDDLPATDWWLTECRATRLLLLIEEWPRWLRRLYIVLFPVSIPIHIVIVVAAAMGIFVTLPYDLLRAAKRNWN
jgi:hypothetical protein